MKHFLACFLVHYSLRDTIERSVEIESGTNEGQVRKRLGGVAQGVATGALLLGLQAQVVGIPKHLFEEQPCVFQSSRIRAAGTGERLNEPERTHVEGSLASW